MNKDGKLFGKISIVDILVVVLIIVLAVGIYARFSGKNGAVVRGSGEKIQCTFLVRNVRDYTIDALNKKGKLYDKTSKELIGDITEVRKEDGEYNVNMADGTFMSVVPEDRYNVYVTVEFEGKSSDNGYYTAANKFLGAGTTVGFTTKFAECESNVYSISEKK